MNSSRSRSFHRTTTLVVALGLLFDQATKLWAERVLGDGKIISVFPTVELDLFFNSGFSFSAGRQFGQIIGLVVAAIVVVLIRALRNETSARRAMLLAVILGGAIGNLVDRLIRADDGFLSGEVVDFIDVSWFAVFNVADSLVVVGAILLILSEARQNRRLREGSATKPS